MNTKIQSVLDFFKAKQLWDITGVHGVNDQKRLNRFIKSDEVMLFEGDIFLSDVGKEIIMAHPPALTSDLTFNDWIYQVDGSKKAAKLDIKKPEVVMPALGELNKLNIKIPILLHADIIKGPGGTAHIFDAAVFIGQCSEYYPKGIISLGWTTNYVTGYTYTETMLREMTSMLKSIDKEQAVTACIRVCYIEQIPQTFFDLFRQNSNMFLTLWNAKDDPPLPRDLEQMMEKYVGLDKVYYDFIDEGGDPVQL